MYGFSQDTLCLDYYLKKIKVKLDLKLLIKIDHLSFKKLVIKN